MQGFQKEASSATALEILKAPDRFYAAAIMMD
jgi:hypothetical protein